MSSPSRPIMRYYGGKWRLAPWIISHFPQHRVYVEPWGGAASVLMRKPRTAHTEVYNDLQDEIVNVFRILRDPASAAELQRLLQLTPFARSEQDLAYEYCEDRVERARRTIVRAFQGFGSAGTQAKGEKGWRRTGFRANAMRSNASPSNDWAAYPEQIPRFVERLSGVLIEQWPALELIPRFDRVDTLFYCDPPYVPESRATGHVYGVEMTAEDHRRCAEVLHSVKGMVVLSGYPSALYDDLYADWERVEIDARAIQNLPRTEVLWLSPACSAALHPRLL